jgi:hypothetical protein
MCRGVRRHRDRAVHRDVLDRLHSDRRARAASRAAARPRPRLGGVRARTARSRHGRQPAARAHRSTPRRGRHRPRRRRVVPALASTVAASASAAAGGRTTGHSSARATTRWSSPCSTTASCSSRCRPGPHDQPRGRRGDPDSGTPAASAGRERRAARPRAAGRRRGAARRDRRRTDVARHRTAVARALRRARPGARSRRGSACRPSIRSWRGCSATARSSSSSADGASRSYVGQTVLRPARRRAAMLSTLGVGVSVLVNGRHRAAGARSIAGRDALLSARSSAPTALPAGGVCSAAARVTAAPTTSRHS